MSKEKEGKAKTGKTPAAKTLKEKRTAKAEKLTDKARES